MELIRQFPAVGRSLGMGLIIIGLISLTAVVVACIYSEWSAILPMLTVTGSLCATGVVLRLIPQNGVKPTGAVSISVTVILWGFVALCGAFPYLFSDLSFIDAMFESMSAWTGTGFSVVENIDEWPHALLFWRSLMEWIGDLGIVVFALVVTTKAAFNRGLFRTEGRKDTFLPSVAETAHHMIKIYLILTAIALVAILCTGVGLWDSINLALCGISTGGLTMYSDGLMHYNNFALEMVLIPIMFLGAIPFRLYYLSYTKQSITDILHDRVLSAMVIVFVLVSIYLVLNLVIVSGLPLEEAFRQGVFMAGSSVTTTGFQNTDLLPFGPAPLLILGVVLLIGGSQESTAGGIKADRIIIAFESIIWWMRKMISSSKTVVSMRHNGKSVKDDEAFSLFSGSIAVILCFILLFLAVLIVLLQDPYFSSNVSGTIFDVMSCISNTGSTAGLFTAGMPEYAKILLIFVMWAGRLEIIPILILIKGFMSGFKMK